MLIAQISDTHIVERGQKTLGVAPMEQNLERVIDHINKLNTPPDVVLLTGDVSEGGTLDQTINAARILENLNFPLYVIPGNHDTRRSLWSVFQEKECPSRLGEFIVCVIEDFDIRLIGLDTTIADAAGGELCDARLAWLETTLSKQPTRPTIIFMHHPPQQCGVLETDVDGFTGAKKLVTIVRKYPNIERILCGHIHLSTHTRWHGTVVSTAPSIGMRLALDLTMKKPSAFFLDEPAYQIHHWTKQNRLVTHTVRVGEDDGPYPFEDSNRH